MRILTPALLALTPALLHAQVATPAQTRPAPVLEAKLSTPRSVEPPAAGANSSLRISNVVLPKLVHTAEVEEDPTVWSSLRGERDVTVSFTVDTQGIPTNIKVVTPFDSDLDARVLTAVSQFRYTPGTLNSVPTDFPITMKVVVVPRGY